MGFFDTVHERVNTKSIKWDGFEAVFNANDVLPMWIADMDFKAPDAVNAALIKRAEHGIFGYTIIDSDLKNTIVNWVQTKHGWEISPDTLSFSPGVVTSLQMAIQAFTEPGDNILIQTPVYPPFYDLIEQHKRNIVKNPLQATDGYYEIDFADFEDKLKTENIKAFIFCSPHNPVGRVWKKEELAEVSRLCLKYNVLILSDEIHSDLIFSGHTHIPIASLSKAVAEQTLTLMAPSKTFNLAGLQASYIITENKNLKEKLDWMIDIQGHKSLNTMGNTALEAAYLHGATWVEELVTVLESHQTYVREMFAKYANELKVTKAEGTYLLWIDCSALGFNSEELMKFMVEEAKVGLNPGITYGSEGEQFMRINIACPRATLEEGVRRIIEALQNR